MNIAFDAKRLMNNFTGLGNYSRALVQNISSYYPDVKIFLYTPKITENARTYSFINKPVYSIRTPEGRSAGELWRSVFVKKQLKKDEIDIYHGLSNQIPVGLKKSNIKSVVTIHDLIFKTFPHTYTAIDRFIYDQKFKYACDNANLIVAVSESTKKDIIRFYNTDESKIRVVYQPVHPVFYEKSTPGKAKIRLKYNLPAEYILSVGTIEKRKNLANVIKALYILNDSQKIPLVVVGRGGKYRLQCQEMVKALKPERKVIWMDQVEEVSDLKALYESARMVVYASHYEGFGLPVVEAALCKTPVITSNVSSMPEAAGKNATLIDPESPEMIAEAIGKLLQDEEFAQQSAEKTFQYALDKFHPQKTTKDILDLYTELLSL